MIKVHQPGDDNPHLEEGGYTVPLTLVPLRPLARQLPPPSGDDGRSATPGGGKDGAPPATTVLGYNGADGNVYLLPSSAGGTASGGADGADGGDGPDAPTAAHAAVVRRYDDAVTALAVSADGLRVAVGFEDGSTAVYSYDAFDPSRSKGGPSDNADADLDDGDDEGAPKPNNDDATARPAPVHPFVLCGREGTPSFSQSQSFEGENEGEERFDGPRLDAAVRDMAFDPRSCDPDSPVPGPASGSVPESSSPARKNKKVKYFLAIASESGNQPLTVVDASAEDTATDAYLQDRSGDEYEGGGAKGVAYSSLPPPEEEGGTPGAKGNVVLSAVGMTGRLTHWDVTSTTDPELMWDLVHAEMAAVMPRDDGLGAGGSGAVLAAKGAWVSLLPKEEEPEPGEEEKKRVPKGVLLVPGKADLQYRVVDLASSNGGELTADELKKELSKAHFASGGHVDDIVAILARDASAGEVRVLTGGADGRVCRWTLSVDSDGNVECAHDGEVEVPPPGEKKGVPPVTSLVWCGEKVLVGRGDGSVVAADVGKRSKGGGGRTAGTAAAASEACASDDDDRTLPAPEDEDEDDGTETDDAEEKAAEEKKKKAVRKLIDDEAEDGSDGEDEVQYDDVIAVERPAEAAADGADGGADEDIAFDDGGDAFDDPPPEDSAAYTSTLGPSFPPNQAPFAPSSTPADGPEGSRRILCWNHVGVATHRPDDGDDTTNGNSVVDVGFHDAAGLVGTGRRPVSFTDNVGFVLGTLGEEGGVFATDVQDDGDEDMEEEDEDLGALGIMSEAARRAARRSTRKRKDGGSGAGGSSVYYHRFETFGSARDKDWVVGLPDGEGAVGLAAGKGWVGVVTR